MPYDTPVPGSTTKRLYIIVPLLLLVGVAALWWGVSDRDSGDGRENATESDSAGPRSPSQLTQSRRSSTIPRWFGQPDVAARRIAGRVVHDDAPLEGAEVRLSSDLFSAGFTPEPIVQTDGDGRFDFGPLPAASYRVTASAPDRGPSGLHVDLRDPGATPAPDQLELTLRDCRARLVGVVEDASRGAIAAATVTVSTSSSISAVIAGDQGRFELCVPEGRSMATVRANGHGTLDRALWAVGRTSVRFTLAPAATVRGRVELAGEPVASALVMAGSTEIPSLIAWSEHTLTDESGAFTFDTLTAGRYSISASAEAGRSQPTPIVLRTGLIPPEVVLTLEGAAPLRGVAMAHDAPVPGVSIWAAPTSGSPWPFGGGQAISQEDGTFVIVGLPPGEFELRSGSHEIVAPVWVQLSPDGKSQKPVTVEVAPLAAIRGRVLRRGEPVADALVVAGARDALSDGTGAFALRRLAPGTYRLTARANRLAASSREVEVELERGATVDGVDLELELAASIAGRVIDERGKPVPGAHLTFVLGDGEDEGRATTGADGSFLATAMSGGGDYSVSITRSPATAMPLLPASGPASTFPPVTVEDGKSQIEGVEFVVSNRSHRLIGRVERRNGAPVADAQVELAIAGRRDRYSSLPQTMSDGDGNFTLQEITPGNYRLQARAGDGTRSGQQSVAVPGDDPDRRLAVVLPDIGSVEGELVGFTEPVQVTLSGQPGRPDYQIPAARERFRFEDIATGQYQVVASGSGATADVTVTANGVAQVTLTQGGTGQIQGRVLDFDSGQPVPGLSCTWLRGAATGDQLALGSIRSDDDGRFTLEAPAGNVRVVCMTIDRKLPDGTMVTHPDVAVRTNDTVTATLYAVTSPTLGLYVDPGFVIGDQNRPEIWRISPDSTAARSGLRRGDVITAVNKASVTRLQTMTVLALLGRHIGQNVELTVDRGGEALTFEIAVEQRKRRRRR